MKPLSALTLSGGLVLIGSVWATPSYAAGTVSGNFSGKVTLEFKTNPFLDSLGYDIFDKVKLEAKDIDGYYLVDPLSLLDGEVVLGYDEFSDIVPSEVTDYIDGYVDAYLPSILGPGLENTISILGQVVDFKIPSNSLFLASKYNDGASQTLSSPIGVTYDSTGPALVADYDPNVLAPCLTYACEVKLGGILEFGLDLDLDALVAFLNSIDTSVLSPEEQTEIASISATVSALLPSLPSNVIPLLSGALELDLDIFDILYDPTDDPSKYAFLLREGTKFALDIDDKQFSYELDEPYIYANYDVSTGGDYPPTDVPGAASVPEPGVIVGLMTAGVLAAGKKKLHRNVA